MPCDVPLMDEIIFEVHEAEVDGGFVASALGHAIATQGDFVVNNNLVVSQVFSTTNLVRAMLYTPCAFDGKNGFTWNGQIYAGAYSALKNKPTFSTDSVGIAGHDLGTGLPSTVITNPKPGSVISNRDLAG